MRHPLNFSFPDFPPFPRGFEAVLTGQFPKKYFKPRKEKIPWKSQTDLCISFVCNSADEPMGVVNQKYNKIPT